MQNIITRNGNIGEVLFTNAELRLFNNDKSERLFQCGLIIDGSTVKVRLAASFVLSERRTLMEVRDVLAALEFKTIEFERELDGHVTVINL